MRQKFQYSILTVTLIVMWPVVGLSQLSEGARGEEGTAANIEQLHALAVKGNRDAQFRLGELYEDGEILNRDIHKAIEYYREAAEQQHPAAQYGLALNYQLGSGVEQNITAAMAWYRKAAQQGHELSQLALGDQYRMGVAVPRDLAESAKWYRRAAEQGNHFAQYELGNAYCYGNGVDRDIVKAIEWFQLSAEAGNLSALLVLKELDPGEVEDARVTAPTRIAFLEEESEDNRHAGSLEPARPLNRIVFLIQDRLNRLGYPSPNSLKVDGQFGLRTSETIAVYQRENGLKIDGRASRDLLHHIEGREISPTQIAELKEPLRGDVAKPSSQFRFRVQLGAFRSSENASRLWQTLESRHSDLLSGLGHLIKRVNSADKGTFTYVYAGPLPTLSSAKSLCRSLIDRKVDCLAVQF